MRDADAELKPMSYPQHILDGYSQGALLDFRMRFAMQLLSRTPMMGDELREGETPAHMSARFALDVAEALFAQAEARGMVTPIDHAAGLPEELVQQAARLGAFQVFQQMGAQAAQRAAQPAVVSVPMVPKPRFNG